MLRAASAPSEILSSAKNLSIRKVARRQKLGKEAEQYAYELRIDAEIRLGEMLKDAPKAKGTRSQLAGKDSSGGTALAPPENSVPALADLGIDKKTSARGRDPGRIDSPGDDAVAYDADMPIKMWDDAVRDFLDVNAAPPTRAELDALVRKINALPPAQKEEVRAWIESMLRRQAGERPH